jgi:hypothetical protein
MRWPFRRKKEEKAETEARPVFPSDPYAPYRHKVYGYVSIPLEKLSEFPDYREKKDWTGWKTVPKPDLKNPFTGEPIMFPPPPEDWKEYGWAVVVNRPCGIIIDPTTGRYIAQEFDDAYGYMRFYEPDGTLRGEFRWVRGDEGYMWTKPKDIKERAKVVEDFLIKAPTTHACAFLFAHCARPLIRTAGVPSGSTSFFRIGAVAIDCKAVHFFNPPELRYKKRGTP